MACLGWYNICDLCGGWCQWLCAWCVIVCLVGMWCVFAWLMPIACQAGITCTLHLVNHLAAHTPFWVHGLGFAADGNSNDSVACYEGADKCLPGSALLAECRIAKAVVWAFLEGIGIVTQRMNVGSRIADKCALRGPHVFQSVWILGICGMGLIPSARHQPAIACCAVSGYTQCP